MTNDDAPKGDVSVEHTVWCCTARRLGIEGMPFTAESTVGHPYGCASHHQASGSALRVIAEARGAGWIKTQQFGWLCPACAAAYAEWKKIQ